MVVDPEIACGIVENIGKVWLDDQFVDLQVLVGDILFNCHQFILSACSKFFNVLLKSEVEGEVGSHIRQVTIRGISPQVFQLVLKALYTGELGLTAESTMAVWHAAFNLQIPFLASKCEKLISSHLTQENFVNIYQNALLLKSVYVTKAAHYFVAQNFESFKNMEILLQQPVNFIEDIIRNCSLLGQSQNHVLEFINNWISYEFNTRMPLQNLALQMNELTVYKNISKTFEKPFGASDVTGQPLERTQFLWNLLQLVNFTQVSKTSLELLTDNNLLMGCKKSRDIIRQAMQLVNSAPTSAANISAVSPSAASVYAVSTSAASVYAVSTPAASSDTEDTVVFVTKGNPRTICAYSLVRRDIFKFCKDSDISNIQTHNYKSLYCLVSKSENNFSILKVTEFPFSKQMETIANCVYKNSVLVGDFCYTHWGTGMNRENIKDGGDWYELFKQAEYMSNPILTVFKDSILFYNSARDRHGKQKVYCFNTVSRRHWHMMTCDYKDCDFVTFTLSDQLYILYGNGVVVNVTSSVTSPAEPLSLPKYSEIPKSQLLWDFQFRIYGAVVYNSNLIVFGDVSSVLVPEIHESKIPGLKTIQFVHLSDLLTNCHPLVIPKKLLTERM